MIGLATSGIVVALRARLGHDWGSLIHGWTIHRDANMDGQTDKSLDS